MVLRYLGNKVTCIVAIVKQERQGWVGEFVGIRLQGRRGEVSPESRFNHGETCNGAARGWLALIHRGPHINVKQPHHRWHRGEERIGMAATTSSSKPWTSESMGALLARQRQAFLDEPPVSAATRIDRIDRAIHLLSENAGRIADTLSADYGCRPRDLSRFTDVAARIGPLKYTRSRARHPEESSSMMSSSMP
jgi:hypothetical protein